MKHAQSRTDVMLGIREVFRVMDGPAREPGSTIACHLPVLFLLAQTTPGCVVELGVGRGHSTMALIAATAASGHPVFSFDKHDRSILKERFGSSWRFVQEDSVLAAQSFEAAVGLLFIDTVHTYEHTKSELDAWLPRMAEGGIMCGHDYLLHERLRGFGVQQAVDEFVAQHADRFELQVLPHDDGFFILWPNVEPHAARLDPTNRADASALAR